MLTLVKQKQTSLLKQPNSAQYPFVSDAKVVVKNGMSKEY